MADNYAAMLTYVSDSTPIDLIAQAWLVLSDPDNSDGKGNRPADDLPEYLFDDWSKLARRTIRGFAEANVRPDYWPWRDARFDAFAWREPNTEESTNA